MSAISSYDAEEPTVSTLVPSDSVDLPNTYASSYVMGLYVLATFMPSGVVIFFDFRSLANLRTYSSARF